MLSDEQLRHLEHRLGALQREVILRLNPGADEHSTFALALRQTLAEIVSRSSGKVRVVAAPAGEEARPSVAVGNVRYLALPTGPELDPFCDLLIGMAAHPRNAALSGTGPDPHGNASEGTPPPPRVEVLIAPSCPHCSAVVAACLTVALQRPEVALQIIDVQYFSDLAGACKSVPTVILDHTRTIVGHLAAEDLLRMLEERHTPAHFALSLTSMVETGRFTDALPLLLTEPGLTTLAQLFAGGDMQQRLGLMLLCEQALEADRHSLDAALPHLLPLLESPDANVRGDTADLLGKIGAPGAREALTRLLSDENPDVREVASDSLAVLRQPS